MGQIKSFKDLKSWQKGLALVKVIYEITSVLPQRENYSLADQMRRSAISIPSNIAEGFKRQHKKELRQFLFVARGSLAELETQLIIAGDLYSIEKILIQNAMELIDHISRMLWNLIRCC